MAIFKTKNGNDSYNEKTVHMKKRTIKHVEKKKKRTMNNRSIGTRTIMMNGGTWYHFGKKKTKTVSSKTTQKLPANVLKEIQRLHKKKVGFTKEYTHKYTTNKGEEKKEIFHIKEMPQFSFFGLRPSSTFVEDLEARFKKPDSVNVPTTKFGNDTSSMSSGQSLIVPERINSDRKLDVVRPAYSQFNQVYIPRSSINSESNYENSNKIYNARRSAITINSGSVYENPDLLFHNNPLRRSSISVNRNPFNLNEASKYHTPEVEDTHGHYYSELNFPEGEYYDLTKLLPAERESKSAKRADEVYSKNDSEDPYLVYHFKRNPDSSRIYDPTINKISGTSSQYKPRSRTYSDASQMSSQYRGSIKSTNTGYTPSYSNNGSSSRSRSGSRSGYSSGSSSGYRSGSSSRSSSGSSSGSRSGPRSGSRSGSRTNKNAADSLQSKLILNYPKKIRNAWENNNKEEENPNKYTEAQKKEQYNSQIATRALVAQLNSDKAERERLAKRIIFAKSQQAKQAQQSYQAQQSQQAHQAYKA